MESFKQYSFKGLDLKRSKILKPSDRARDLDNVHIDPHNHFSLIKRFGLTDLKNIPNLVDIIYYKTGSHWVYVCASGLWVDSGVTIAQVPFGGYSGLDANYTVPVSYQEINGCLYIADPAGNNDMFKYDGVNFYKAGVPTPIKVTNILDSSGQDLTAQMSWDFGYSDISSFSGGNLVLGGVEDFKIQTGSLVKYTVTGSTTLIDQLTPGTSYYVYVSRGVSTTTIAFYTSRSGAMNAGSVDKVAVSSANGGVAANLQLTDIQYMRIAPFYRDSQGNITWGDYWQSDALGLFYRPTYSYAGSDQGYLRRPIESVGSLQYNLAADTKMFMRLKSYNWKILRFIVPGGTTVSILNNSTVTLTLASTIAALEPVIGDVLYVSLPYSVPVGSSDTTQQWKDTKLTVTAKAAGAITLSIPDCGTIGLTLGAIADTYYIFSNMRFGVFISYDNASYGYYYAGETTSDWGDPTAQTYWSSSGLSTVYYGEKQGYSKVFGYGFGIYQTENFMEDFYDTTVVKGLPPMKPKYVGHFNKQLLIYNSADDLNSLDTTENAQNSMRFYWSDTSLGSSVETFGPFGTEIIGSSQDGVGTGIFGGQTRVVLFKQNQIYYVEGALSPGGYRVYSALTNGVGCVAHRSIIEHDGSCLFLSQKGIYSISGGQPVEITEQVENFFCKNTIGSIFSGTLAARSTKDERMFFFIPATTLANDRLAVWDYANNEWFFWSGVHARAGIQYLVDPDTAYIGYNGVFTQFKDGVLSDNGVAISAKYITSWIHLDTPGMLKKFDKIVIYALEESIWTCGVRVYLDYDETNFVTLQAIPMGNGVHVAQVRLQATQAKAISIEIFNNTLNQDIDLSGMEIEIVETQKRISGENNP